MNLYYIGWPTGVLREALLDFRCSVIASDTLLSRPYYTALLTSLSPSHYLRTIFVSTKNSVIIYNWIDCIFQNEKKNFTHSVYTASIMIWNVNKNQWWKMDFSSRAIVTLYISECLCTSSYLNSFCIWVSVTVDLRVDWRGFRQRMGWRRNELMVVVTTVASLVVVA